jgi:hypothetical protein
MSNTHPAYALNHDEPPMPSVERQQDRQAEAVERFRAAAEDAVDDLGWEAVNRIMADMRARE